MFDNERVDVVVEFMIGDSLGQHLIGGFIESFSSTYACRFCENTRDEYKSNPSVTKPQRTRKVMIVVSCEHLLQDSLAKD